MGFASLQVGHKRPKIGLHGTILEQNALSCKDLGFLFVGWGLAFGSVSGGALPTEFGCEEIE
jgi:hypothetical protein